MLRQFNVKHVNVGKAMIPNNLHKNRVIFTWTQVYVFILAGANTGAEFIHVQACTNIRSLRHQELHILILIESSKSPLKIDGFVFELDEEVKILAN